MIPESVVIGRIALTFFRMGLRGRLRLLFTIALLAVPLLGTLFARFEMDRRLEERLVTEAALMLAASVIVITAISSGAAGLAPGPEVRMLQPFLTLPVPRRAILLGHELGVAGTVALYTAVLGLSIGGLLEMRFSSGLIPLAIHFFTLFLEAVILAAIASLLAQVGSTLFAYMATLLIAGLSHASGMIQHLVQDSSQAFLDRLVSLVTVLLPDLQGLDVRASVVRDLPVPWDSVLPSVAHGLLYLLTITLIAGRIFERREMA